MTSEIRTNTIKNRVGLGTVSYTNTGIVVSGIVTANSFSGPYNGTDIVGTGITLTSTDAGSSAAPIINLFRNSASPANADYLGQIKFQGESSTGVQRNYAKITGKILDVTNGSEDGILEFAHIKGGSQTITGRWRSDSLQLLNDTNLSVAGDTTFTGDLDVDGHTNLDNVSIAGITTTTENIRIQGNNKYLTVGASNQIGVVHTGGEAFITNSTGHLTHRCDVHKWENLAGSAEYLRIDSSGQITNTGIATSFVTTQFAANFAKLDLRGTNIANSNHYILSYGEGHANDHEFHMVNTLGDLVFRPGGTEALRLTSTGKIGIGGETSPEFKVTVYDAGYSGVTIKTNRNSAADNIGGLHFKTRTTNVAYIQSLVDGTIKFRNSASLTERLRISSNSQILHTRTDNVQRYDLEFRNTGGIGAGNYGGIHWTQGASGATSLGGIEIAYADTGRPDIVFKTRQSGGNSMSEALRITSDGKIGVNTPSPIGTLDVYDGTFVLSKPNASGNERNWRFVNNNVAAGNLGLQVSTAAGGSTFSNLIEITRDGKVGINEGSPDFMLHLSGSVPAICFEDTDGTHGQAIIEQNGDNLKIRQDAGNASSGTGSNIRFEVDSAEKLRITSQGYVHLGTNFHLNKVGGESITGNDFEPIFKIYNTTSSKWLMNLRNDHSTAPNGIFMRAGNSSSNYSMYITGGDENKPHIIARGDQRVGIASATPYTTLDVGGSINAGTANQPYQRMFSAGGHQRATKHYFRCVRGGYTTYDIVTVDLNQNFHQAICKVFYGTRLQNISDSTTQVNEIIFGINRFIGNTPTRNRQVIHQDTNSANHADIDVVITSSTQYRVRLTFSGSTGGSSFAGGYVELIGVGSGGDGAFYSLAHSSGINY